MESMAKFLRKKETAPTPEEAIQKLRETEEMLVKKSEHIETMVKNELMNAKKHGTKNKRLALQALKRKKRLENQQVQIDNTLTTIEFQREALENASTNTAILTNMSYAAKAMKKASGDRSADDVHEMLDELEDANYVAEEISRAISRPLGYNAEMDELEEELMKELEAIEQEELDEKMLEVKNTPKMKLPNAPQNDPVAAKPSKEDQELADLQQWMA